MTQMQQFRLVLTCLLLSVPCLVDAYESSDFQSTNTEAANAAQELHGAESQTVEAPSAEKVAKASAEQQVHEAESQTAQAQSAEKAAEDTAAQQVHAAESQRAHTQSLEMAAKAEMTAAGAKAMQQAHAADSEAAHDQSAMKSAEAKAAQQVHAADFQAAHAQSLMKAAEAKAAQAEATAAQSQLAEKAQATKAAQQVYAAQKDAANARAAEMAEQSYAAAKMAFLSHKAEMQVHSEQSEVASAWSAQAKTEAESSVVSHLLVAFPILVILFFLMKKTPQGRAFKDRMSDRISGIVPERISGMVSRKDDKKKPLLSQSKEEKNVMAHYQNLKCSKCFKSVPGQMTLCVNHSMVTSNCIDGYSALCPAHKHLVGCSQKYAELAPPHVQVDAEVKPPVPITAKPVAQEKVSAEVYQPSSASMKPVKGMQYFAPPAKKAEMHHLPEHAIGA